MAQVNRDSLLTFAAAVSAVTLSTSGRLKRNFSYYRNGRSETIMRDELVLLCRGIRHDAFGLHNLMESDESRAPFFVALAGRIADRLEELHRKLLFFDSALIADIIPELDTERAFWANLTDPGFYSDLLTSRLEHDIPGKFIRIEIHLNRLPDSVPA
jgi:hypothetical protein